MSGGGMLLNNRTGMSPLIATVLLMAFAVALGAMVMNWGIDINTNSDCEMLNKHIKVQQFCSRDGKIILRATADADSPVLQGISLLIHTGSVENVANVKNSELAPRGSLDLAIDVPISEAASVDLIGVIGPKAEPVVCENAPIESVDPITPCPT